MLTTHTKATALFTPYNSGPSEYSEEQKLRDHAGQRAVAVPSEPSKYDPEVGPMFVVTFADGYTSEAFEDELTEWETTN